ncbi:MAG: hypothetical protein Kow0068_23960 [Marinilabiliales bacterium]
MAAFSLLPGFLVIGAVGISVAIIIYLIIKRLEDKKREKDEFEDRPW